MASNSFFLTLTLLLSVFIVSSQSSAQLSTHVYSKSCPGLFNAVKSNVRSAISKEAKIGASLLRLFFLDCFVNGCDGSILLDDTETFIGEKKAAPNMNSVRGFDVIDKIKSDVEKMCPGVVSCADIVAIAARDSVVTLGAPSWEVKLGRRDSLTASQAAVNTSLPAPTFNLSQLAASFNNVGLSFTDMVALSGAHTIGMARCTSFRDRIYNDANIDPSFARTRRQNCPKATGSGDDNPAPLDVGPTVFDNSYYKTLVSKRGLLHSDQELFSGGTADLPVVAYAVSDGLFYSDFAKGMIKMGDIKPLTGSMGEIRKNCRRVNM